jgi:tetratricopeptide (TPR) repeat protein
MWFGKKYWLLCLVGLSSSAFCWGQAIDAAARKKAFQFIKAAETFTYQGSPAWVAWLDSAQKADPSLGQPFLEKARVHNMRGDFSQGFRLLDQAIQLDPINYLGYQAWFKIYYLRDYEGGQADLIKADALTPNTIDYPGGDHLYYLLGMAEAGMGHTDEALRQFDRYVQEETARRGQKWVNVIAYLRMAHLHYLKGDVDLALPLANKVLAEHPNEVEAHYLQGIILLRMGDKTAAIKALYRALELFTANHEADHWLLLEEGYCLDKETVQEKLAQATGIK